MNVVEAFVSMAAVRVFKGSALTHCFGLAGRDYTFDGRTVHVHLKKVSGLGLGLTVRV